MINALDASRYIASVYKAQFNEIITEMKLHKLLYFAQREALVKSDKPLFQEIFEGWRFGPVIPSIRYKFSEICESSTPNIDKYSKDMDSDGNLYIDEAEYSYADV